MKKININITEEECDMLFKLLGFEIREMNDILCQANRDGLPVPEAYVARRELANGLVDKLNHARYGK